MAPRSYAQRSEHESSRGFLRAVESTLMMTPSSGDGWREWRENRGFSTIAELAQFTGLAPTTIAAIESGRTRGSRSTRMLLALAIDRGPFVVESKQREHEAAIA